MSAKDYAVKLLGFCDRSEKEIRERILKKGYSEEECDEAVRFCREYGYLNDERFARRFVHDATQIKKYGKMRIAMELRQKGIDESIAQDALDEVCDEREVLLNEMKRRFSDADFSDKKVKNKVLGYFVRRGFKMRDIFYAMNEDYDGYDE